MIFHTLSDYLQPWILPPGFNLFFLIIGLFLRGFFRKISTCLILIGIISLLLFSMPIIAYKLIDILQNKYPLLNELELNQKKSRTAIVVLGGGETILAEYKNKLTISDFTLHRVNYGAYLLQKTNLPIILSGGRINQSKSEADLMAEVLIEKIPNVKNILLENKSKDTAEEGRNILTIIKKNHLNQIYLVTNAWHMPRSVYIFECNGINVVPAPMGYFLYDTPYTLLSFFPNKEAFYTTAIAMHEYIGLLWYKFTHPQCALNK